MSADTHPDQAVIEFAMPDRYLSTRQIGELA